MVEKGNYELLWSKRAILHFENIFKYIRERSVIGAENVRMETFEKLAQIILNPKIF